MLDNSHLLPGWLAALFKEKFFTTCKSHEDTRKNEKNIFCLDCCEAICPHCRTPHFSHRLLQVRRYIYHDVLRLKDAEKLLDCVSIQSYISNSEKVVFLNQRPMTRNGRGSAKLCIICDRAVQESFHFCSISCKLQHMIKTGVKLTDHICNRETLVLPEPGFGDPGFGDDVMTPETVSNGSASSASGSGGGDGGEIDCRTLATTEIVKKKRSNLSATARSSFTRITDVPVPAVLPVAVMNRRKNRPRRSPLQ